jgi:predicted acylesterase/phospholipase RssA
MRPPGRVSAGRALSRTAGPHGGEGTPPDALPFRRIAVVLSGGGAFGAYEVGVLKVLERLRIRPSIMAGVSVGAINALLWIAHDTRTEPLVRTWSALNASAAGMRWTTLGLRALGMVLVTLALLEILLGLAGSPELGLLQRLPGGPRGAGHGASVLLDIAAWTIVAIVGVVLSRLSRRVEAWLAGLPFTGFSRGWRRWFGRVLLILAGLHALTWAFGLPWPHRFSATALLAATAVWLFQRSGGGDRWLRALLIRMLPETGGRGAWGSSARRQLIERVLATGRPRRLVNGDIRLMISACALDTGAMTYFINWPDPGEGFRRRVRRALGEVRVMRRPRELVQAALASSALPIVYEPVQIDGHDYVDGAVFANQPLHVLLPDEADAAVVVLLSPASRAAGRRGAHLVDLGAQLLELANWRDLQAELRALPQGWSRTPEDGAPARICVVEPREPLPGGVLGFHPENAAELMRLGERDALEALAAAGWRTGGADAPRPA